MPPRQPAITDRITRPLIYAGWFLLVVMYFFNSWGGSLRPWDEGLSAERSREMLQLGEYLTPHLDYHPDFNKPPLYYWLTAATMRIAGINEFSVRLWSILFGIGCCVLVYHITSRIARSPIPGHAAAFLLAFNPFWMNMTRQGLLDSGMLLGVLVSFYFLLFDEKRIRRNLLAGLAIAFALMIKGPVALFPIPVFIGVFAFTDRKRMTDSLGALAFGLIIASPWYIYQVSTNGREFLTQFVTHNLQRRLTETIEGHTGTLFSYLATWLEQAPVSFAVFIVTTLAIVRHRSAFDRQRAVLVALLYGSLLVLSLLPSKRELYLLIPLPFYAILTAVSFMAIRKGPPLRALGVPIAVVALLMMADFFRLYDANPDHSDGAKEVAIAALRRKPDNPVILSYMESPHLFAFYTRQKVRKIGEGKLPLEIRKLQTEHHGLIIILLRVRDSRQFHEEIQQVVPPAAVLEFAREDDYMASEVVSRPPDQSD